jgi:hypothetical protein
MEEKWNTWEIWGKIGILAKNLGKIGILAKNLGKIGILTKNLGKSGILAKKLGKIGLLGKIWEKMWFLEYILIFFSIVLPLVLFHINILSALELIDVYVIMGCLRMSDITDYYNKLAHLFEGEYTR